MVFTGIYIFLDCVYVLKYHMVQYMHVWFVWESLTQAWLTTWPHREINATAVMALVLNLTAQYWKCSVELKWCLAIQQHFTAHLLTCFLLTVRGTLHSPILRKTSDISENVLALIDCRNHSPLHSWIQTLSTSLSSLRLGSRVIHVLNTVWSRWSYRQIVLSLQR